MVPPETSGSPGEIIDSDALDSARGGIGQLAHLAYGTRPYLAASDGELSARETHLTHRDVSAVNDLVRLAKETASEFLYCVKNDLCLDRLHVISFCLLRI